MADRNFERFHYGQKACARRTRCTTATSWPASMEREAAEAAGFALAVGNGKRLLQRLRLLHSACEIADDVPDEHRIVVEETLCSSLRRHFVRFHPDQHF